MTPEPSSWSLARIWRALRRYWAIIAIFVVAGGGGSYAIGMMTPPTYESTSTLAFSVTRGSTAADLANGSIYAQDQMQTYAQLTTSSAVLQPVIDELSLDMSVQDLAESIVVTNPPKTLVLQINVSASSADRSADLANAVAQSLTEVVGSTSTTPTEGSSPSIEASLVDTAMPPRHQSSPNKSRQGLLGALGGLVVGCAVVLVLALLDTKIRDGEDLRRTANVPLLGSVPKVKDEHELNVTEHPGSLASEQFRRLRSTVKHVTATQSTCKILVTSPTGGDGRTTISAGLATTLARLGDKVLLIDADLHRPGVAALFGLDGEETPGLSGVLTGGATFAASKRYVAGSGLDILTSGRTGQNAAELLTSDRMQAMLDEAGDSYDVVVIDSPAALDTADVSLLAPQSDGVIVVVNADRTNRSVLLRTLSSLEAAGSNVTGAVLNRYRRGRAATEVLGRTDLPREER